MTKYEIVGLEEVKFTDKKTGELVHGRRIHLSYDLDERNDCEGIGAEQIFLRTERAFTAKMGDFVNLLYNKYGKVADILILDK